MKKENVAIIEELKQNLYYKNKSTEKQETELIKLKNDLEKYEDDLQYYKNKLIDLEKEKKFDNSQHQKEIEDKERKIVNLEFEIKNWKTEPKDKTFPRGILKTTPSGKYQESTPTETEIYPAAYPGEFGNYDIYNIRNSEVKEPNPFWAAYDPYGYNNPSEKDKPYKIKKDNEKKTLCIGGIQVVKNDSPNDYKEDFQNLSRSTKRVKHPDSEGESDESQDENSYSGYLANINSKKKDRNNGSPKFLGLGGIRLVKNDTLDDERNEVTLSERRKMPRFPYPPNGTRPVLIDGEIKYISDKVPYGDTGQYLEIEPPYEVNCHNRKFSYLRGNTTNDSLYGGGIRLDRCQ